MRNDNGILPNVTLPRRMWAGSRIQFLHEIPLDAVIERTSTLISATPKSGRSGEMLFVTVERRIGIEGGETAIIEQQDLVYKEAAALGSTFVRGAADPGSDDPWTRTITPDPVMLFRYSALTFNAHRIHYDHEYSTRDEGYPGLVVQGPLIATLMLDHILRKTRNRVATFSFRAASPSFVNETITLGYRVHDTGAQLRAVGSAGVLMTGGVEFG